MKKFKKALATTLAVVSATSALCMPVSASTDMSTYENEKILESGFVDISKLNSVYATTEETKDISSDYTWISQGNTQWCWAVVGSHILSYAFGNITPEDVVTFKYGNADDTTVGGSNTDIKNYFDSLQSENGTSYTWNNVSATVSTFNRIKAAIGNNRPVALRITYTKNGVTKSHELLCVGYKITSSDSQLYFYDSAPSSASTGKYWGTSYNVSDNTFTTTLYGTCTVQSGYFIIK
ncbi:MAG: C39 family peptidase [Huintestinicola sp.]